MPLSTFYPYGFARGARCMVFIDGENLAIRYKNSPQVDTSKQADHIFYEPDIFVWSQGMRSICAEGGVVRKYYYTPAAADGDRLLLLEDRLKEAGIEEPHVFKKTKTRTSKAVDISLATDMLLHACRGNYTAAILVAGDGDYVPLVKAVKGEGRQVFLWFLTDGLSAELKRSVDHYADIGNILYAQGQFV